MGRGETLAPAWALRVLRRDTAGRGRDGRRACYRACRVEVGEWIIECESGEEPIERLEGVFPLPLDGQASARRSTP